LSSLRKGWYVRGFSGGELVSMLFAFHAGMKGVLLDPPPRGALRTGGSIRSGAKCFRAFGARKLRLPYCHRRTSVAFDPNRILTPREESELTRQGARVCSASLAIRYFTNHRCPL
jgi:hypothetical protein